MFQLSDLELAAARYAIGTLQSLEMSRLADAALRAGVVYPATTVLGTLESPTIGDAQPLFLEWLDEMGMQVPDKDAAVWTILGHMMRRIATKEVPAREGLARVIEEGLHDADIFSKTRKYVGDSHGIHHLVGAYHAYDDLDERPDEVSFAGKYGQEAIAALDEDIVRLAGQWCRDHADQAADGTDAASSPCR